MGYVTTRRSKRRGLSGPGGGFIPGQMPGTGLPDIVPAGVGMQANTPASLYPLNVKWGDVMTVTGPFAGMFQGQVVVSFVGADPVAVYLTGPYGGSVVVPEGAQSGSCSIDVNGSRVFGSSCTIRSTEQARAPERRGQKGYGAGMMGEIEWTLGNTWPLLLLLGWGIWAIGKR